MSLAITGMPSFGSVTRNSSMSVQGSDMQPSVRAKPLKAYSYLGFLLLAAYLAQDFFNLKWAWLVTLQTGETFKQLTGLLLLSYLGHQWYLSRLRLKGRAEAAREKLSQHKTWGALAPLVFYVHSHSLGHGYLLLFSSVYLSNLAVGLLNHEVVKIRHRWFLTGWMLVHVSLAVVLLILVSYHAFIAFYYQ